MLWDVVRCCEMVKFKVKLNLSHADCISKDPPLTFESSQWKGVKLVAMMAMILLMMKWRWW